VPGRRSVPGRGGPERRRRPRPDGTEPRCSRDCSRDAPQYPGMSSTGRDGAAASAQLGGLVDAKTAPASTPPAQFRSRRATTASPSDSCPRGGGHQGRASPSGQAEPTAPRCARVILAVRATSVPFTAVLTGPQRTTTDNNEPALTCTVPRPRRSWHRPIWLWEQGVNVADVAIELSQAAQVGAH
jgi:hypothetical protein